LDALIEDRNVFLQRFSDPRVMASPLIYTFLAIAGFGIGTVFVAKATGFSGSLLTILLAAPTIMLAQSAPFFYAGFGAREATLLMALPEIAAIDANLLISLSILTGLMVFVVSVPGSIIFLFQTLLGFAAKSKRGQETYRP